MITQVERLARVEVEVQALKESLEDYKTESNRRFEQIDKKLDDLLALRNKGAGILWFLGPVSLIIFEVVRYFIGGK